MDSTLRLMSVNLLHEACDVPRFARLLDELTPDVVVTQELAHEAAEVLAGVYPNHRLRPSPGYTGRGIATRLDATFDDIPMPERFGTSATLSVGGRTLRVAGVHLLNPINFPWWTAAARRRKQVEATLGWLENGSSPAVVAGDLNASPIWPAYRRLTRHLRDLVAEHKTSLGAKPEPTWGWRPGWPRMLRIDHVLGIGVEVFDCLVAPVAGSDHFAVVVDLALGPDAV